MRKWAVVITAAALLATGCAEDGEGEAAADDESLQGFLGMPDGSDPEAMEAQWAEQQLEREEHIAECMAEQGFEYVPREQPTGSISSHPREDMSEDEFREEYGFGISTVEREEMSGAVDDASEDPNFAIQEDMDEAEREAYQEALHGEQPDEEGSGEWEPGGCQQEAQEAAGGTATQLQAELGDELQQMYERVQADPRITEAEEGWAACMRDAGWEFSERFEVHQHLSEQMNELRQGAYDDMPDFDPSEEPSEEPPEPPEPDPDALAELQAEELELAEIDWECTVEHLGEDYRVMQDVQAEYERDFIEEHRDVLEEIRDS